MTKIICGVDVAARSLQARIGRQGPGQRFANSRQGIGELAEFCRKHQAELVVMEATGGYEKQPYAWLWAQGIAVAIVNPRSVRYFAEGMGQLEKTDRIDAGMIAWFAETKHVAPLLPLSQKQQRLKALVTRLRQLTELRTMQLNQQRLVEDVVVLKTFRRMMKVLAQQIKELETTIAALIAEDPLWQNLNRAFRSIKGVADRTVAQLIADMPEIGSISNKAIGKLAGLAPLARDSGERQGKRMVRGGRRGIRRTLFVVAMLAWRFNADFAAFHQRLTAAGKAKKVVRIAVAHKLLIRLNAKAREVRAQAQLMAAPAC